MNSSSATFAHSAGPANAVRSDERPRFLSEADCHDIVKRVERFTRGGGFTTITAHSIWSGNVRWARNQVSTSGEVRNTFITIERSLNGAPASAGIGLNDISDGALIAATRRAERIASLRREAAYAEGLVGASPLEVGSNPRIFSDATYNLDAERRAEVARELIRAASGEGMLSAGYIEVSAHSQAVLDTLGRTRYCQWTSAQYTVTVRDPQGTGSGWAGVDWYDWNRIDGPKLSAIALDKCLKSRNPAAVEPGRYTTILEPQAVCDFIGWLGLGWPEILLNRSANESPSSGGPGPFNKTAPNGNQPGVSMLGDKVIDERISISADPEDPELGFPPFDVFSSWPQDRMGVHVFHPAQWIERGVLKQLGYDREYAIKSLGLNTGLPVSGALRISGGTTSVDEMIATTRRGLVVTRFDRVEPIHKTSMLVRGYSRDGLWLVENGKITKPVKNMLFLESITAALNNVEQLGVPQRTFRRGWAFQIPQPVVAPPMKIRDFNFTTLTDAV